jgi:hypothetical protein
LPDLTQKQTTVKKTDPKPISRNDKVALMLKNIRAAKGEDKKTLAFELVEYKRKCKVSYTILGMNNKDIELVTKLTQK